MKKPLVIGLILLLSLTGCKSTNNPPVQYKPDDELVVLAHGLGRSDWAMRYFAQQLKHAHYKVCSLNYASLGQSVEAVFTQTTTQINACIANVSEVHFVGHSLGGLVIRAYLQNNPRVFNGNTLGNVVLIGTPNKGSELANHLNGSWLMHIAGGVSQSLITGSKSLGNTINELDIDLGVIAGTKASTLTQHYFKGKNDGLVFVESAKLRAC
ncbi:esterase/lipase family protein [Pseudoalteromonas agarivorans]|uniref:esterase/lipase family protein n=1 Tax=Pseudoalteromonas agarivorans TaxID=176102 RepID=UPI0003FA4936|nr:alpha/beta fold hydrolase [Pseudoalteromonas agarivorans]